MEARWTRKVPEVSAVAAFREDLKSQLFQNVDRNGDGKLHKEEMRSLADLVGFEGTDEEWTVEYEKFCTEHSVEPASGIPREIVMTLLEDRSESGCYCTTKELRDIVGEIQGGGADAGVDAAPAADPAQAGEQAASSCTVFFASANYNTDEEVLRSTFEEAGAIKDFQLFRMADGRSRGMGRVKFCTPEEAAKAVVVLNQQMVDGRRIVVKVDTKAEEQESSKGTKGGSSGSGGFKHSKYRVVGEEGAGGGEKGGAGGDKGAAAWDKPSGGKSSGSKAAAGGKGAAGGGDFAAGTKPSGGKGLGGQGGGWGTVAGGAGAWGKESSSGHAWESSHWEEQASSNYASNTVFFAGASFDTTAAVLRKHFEEAGRIKQFWLFQHKDGRSRGMGVVQYHSVKEAKHSVQVLNGMTIDGRELLVKADDVGALQVCAGYDDGASGSQGGQGLSWDTGGWDDNAGQGGWGLAWTGGSQGSGKGWDKSGGSIGSNGYGRRKGGGWKGRSVRSNRVFFAGAPFAASSQMLEEYFQEFGHVRSFTLFRLRNGRSRGMGVCTFHSTEEAAWVLSEGISIEDAPLYLHEDIPENVDSGKGGDAHEAMATYGGAPAWGGKGQRAAAAAYQDYSEDYGAGYDYGDGYQGYADYDEWGGYEAGRSSGHGRGRGRGGGGRGAAAGRGYGGGGGGGSKPSGGPPVTDPKKAVFFTNAPFGTTESHLRRLFSSVGQITNFTLYTTSDGRSRGMGVVEYTTEDSAERAFYELHQTEVSGRPIVVDACRPA